MSNNQLPAISIGASPGRRDRMIDMAVEIERRGFSGIFCPSMGDPLALCLSLAHATNTIQLGTAIMPIYLRRPADMASTAAYIHEVSNGRFLMGLGVAHGPVHQRHGVTVGPPLSDMAEYVAAMRAAEDAYGPLPPIILATLRNKMLQLAAEISAGAVFANVSRNDFPNSVAKIPPGAGVGNAEGGFFVGNIIPTVIDDDEKAAAARNRNTLRMYVTLPNYRNYWRQAGYGEEMDAAEQAVDAGDDEGVLAAMSDRWLDNATLFGSPSKVRDKLEEWYDAGCSTPIVMPSSTSGGQLKALEELFDIFA